MSEPVEGPPDAVRAAGAALGAFQGCRPDLPRSVYWRYLAVLAGLTVGFVWFGVALVRRSADTWLVAVLVALMVGGLAVVGFVGSVVVHRVRTVGAIELYEFADGLVRLTARDVVAFPWRGSTVIENAYWEGPGQGGGSVKRVFVLVRTDHSGPASEPLVLTADVERICALVTEANLPDVLTAARSPNGASFGPVTLGPDGITAQNQTTPWVELDRVTRERDEIRIYRAGQARPWVRTPIGSVPGAPVLLAVAQRLLADAGRGGLLGDHNGQ